MPTPRSTLLDAVLLWFGRYATCLLQVDRNNTRTPRAYLLAQTLRPLRFSMHSGYLMAA